MNNKSSPAAFAASVTYLASLGEEGLVNEQEVEKYSKLAQQAWKNGTRMGEYVVDLIDKHGASGRELAVVVIVADYWYSGSSEETKLDTKQMTSVINAMTSDVNQQISQAISDMHMVNVRGVGEA